MDWPGKASQRRRYLHRPLKNEKVVREGEAAWLGQSPWGPRELWYEKGARVTGERPEKGCDSAFSPEILPSSGCSSQDFTPNIDTRECQEKHRLAHSPATPVWFPFHLFYSFLLVQSSSSSVDVPGGKIRKTFCTEFLLHVRRWAVHFITYM